MKYLYTVLGSVTLGLGVLGIFLPLLPTTPFLLLSAWFYCHGSVRLYGWLMGHPYLGSYVRNYRLNRAMTVRAKVAAIALLCATVAICMIWVADALWLRILLGAVLIGVTGHLLSFRTVPDDCNLSLYRPRGRRGIAAADALYGGMGWRYRDADVESLLLKAGGRYVGFMTVACRNGAMVLESLHMAEHPRRMEYESMVVAFLEYRCLYRRIETLGIAVDRADERRMALYSELGFVASGAGDAMVEKRICDVRR